MRTVTHKSKTRQSGISCDFPAPLAKLFLLSEGSSAPQIIFLKCGNSEGNHNSLASRAADVPRSCLFIFSSEH
jgi:hypothetical protein